MNFVVFDFTDGTTTDASRGVAASLGLRAVFDEYEGETGTVLVVDAVSISVQESVHGVV